MGNLPKSVPAGDTVIEELGCWLGRREAFARIAGGCSAAEAESIRRIRTGKLHEQIGLTWDEFCSRRLGSSRRNIDRMLKLLEEFGPRYFHVAQMAHVTADEYRAIAGHVGEDGIRFDGAVIALLPENSEQVSAAVAELVARERPAEPKPAAVSPAAALKRCGAAADALAALDGSLDDAQQYAFANQVMRLIQAARGLGVPIPRV